MAKPLVNEKTKNNTEYFGVRLNPEQAIKLRELAWKKKTKVAQLIRLWLLKGLDKN